MKRSEQMLEMYKSGSPMQKIATSYGITRSRVQQLIYKQIKSDIRDQFGLEYLSHHDEILLEHAAHEVIEEIRGRRKTARQERLNEKFGSMDLPDPSKFRTVASFVKAANIEDSDLRKFFPNIIEQISQNKKNRWSIHYNSCRNCGTTSTKHRAIGLCSNCYVKSDIFKEQQRSSRLRN